MDFDSISTSTTTTASNGSGGAGEVGAAVLNTSLYPERKPSLITRQLLASNVDLVDKATAAAAHEASVTSGMGGPMGFG